MPALPTQQSILDSGCETLTELFSSLQRGMAAMQLNQVLEVIVPWAHFHTDISAWCIVTGQEFLASQQRPDGTIFWIRKRSPVA